VADVASLLAPAVLRYWLYGSLRVPLQVPITRGPIADDDVRTRIVRTLVAESAAGGAISATVRDGLTLFEDLAFRPTQVRKFRRGQPPPRDDLAVVRRDAVQPFTPAWT